jgi:hypothetical protein
MIRLARALGPHRRVPLATPEECASGRLSTAGRLRPRLGPAAHSSSVACDRRAPAFALKLRRARHSLVRLRAKRYGETSTKLEERSRGGGGEGRAGESPEHGRSRSNAACSIDPLVVRRKGGLRHPTRISGALEPVFGLARRAASNGRRPDTLPDRSVNDPSRPCAGLSPARPARDAGGFRIRVKLRRTRRSLGEGG